MAASYGNIKIHVRINTKVKFICGNFILRLYM